MPCAAAGLAGCRREATESERAGRSWRLRTACRRGGSPSAPEEGRSQKGGWGAGPREAIRRHLLEAPISANVPRRCYSARFWQKAPNCRHHLQVAQGWTPLISYPIWALYPMNWRDQTPLSKSHTIEACRLWSAPPCSAKTKGSIWSLVKVAHNVFCPLHDTTARGIMINRARSAAKKLRHHFVIINPSVPPSLIDMLTKYWPGCGWIMGQSRSLWPIIHPLPGSGGS